MSALDDLKAKEELTGLEFAVYMLAITGTGEPEEAAAELAAKDAVIEAARAVMDAEARQDIGAMGYRLHKLAAALAKLEGAK